MQQTTKIFRFKKELLGIFGAISGGMLLMEWYKSGALTAAFPVFEAEASMIVVRKDGTVWEYENCRAPFQIEGKYCAFGSGQEGGMVALELGCTSVEAVEIVSRFNTGCGGGCDFLEL